MTALGFLVTLEAQPGREDEVVAFLMEAKALVDLEPGTRSWSAFRSGPSSFAIFDVFDSEHDRDVHLHGEVRKALQARGGELFSQAPVITAVEVLAEKQQA
ncbi:antibiotic biosynthesis monooxygenase [Mycolicibacterium cosmeticum]